MSPVRVIFFVNSITQNLDAAGTVTYENITLQQVAFNAGPNKVGGNLNINTVGGTSGITGGLITVDVTEGDLGPLDP